MLTKTRLPSLQSFWQVYRGSSDFHTEIGVFIEFQWQHKCSHSSLEAKHLRWAILQELLFTWPFRSKSEITSTRACAVTIISDAAVEDSVDVSCVQKTHPLKPAQCITQAVKFSLPANHVAGFIGRIGTNLEFGGGIPLNWSCALEAVITPWGS